MRVVSAFFADAASVHDHKLFILGGVWDWLTVRALPHGVQLQLAVIAQLEPDDAGRTRELRVSMTDPAGSTLWSQSVAVEIAHELSGDHMALALALAPRLEVGGRHVTLVEVDRDAESAFALPLRVQTLPDGE